MTSAPGDKGEALMIEQQPHAGRAGEAPRGTPKGQLDGVLVLDLSRVLAGPLAGQMLADLGARVIKVEQPGTGDESRRYGPPFFEEGGAHESAFYLCANRSKESVTIDFGTPEGQDLVRRLAVKADVVIENFRVGTLARYGLGYAQLKELNPRLVYCSLTGFGQDGPHHQRPGYDAIFQAMGGLMSSIGYPDGTPCAGPLRTGLSITDVITSLYADVAILSALYARDARGGTGEYIDMALMDATVATMSHYALYYLVSGRQPPRRGNGGNGGVPSQAFPCADGAVMLTVGNDAQFARFAQALGHPEWLQDPRFATGVERIRHREVLIPMLEELFRQQPAQHWLDVLLAADIPCGPIQDLPQVFADPQVRHRGLLEKLPHASGAEVSLVANPIRFREHPIAPGTAPPQLGQHTQSVLATELGLDERELARLRERRVI
jgi:crotonobetainyl-CoA:carnitine CoA-transferase CaiB-like acyl-CoA transferase